MFAIDSTPEHMARVIGQNRVMGENMVIDQNMLARHTINHGQGHRSKHATTTAPWAQYKGRCFMFAIVSTPEHMARVTGQNTL